MTITVVEFSRDTKLERVWAKNQLYSKDIIELLKIGVMASCQKLGIILENKVV